jgi:hypothetical protein
MCGKWRIYAFSHSEQLYGYHVREVSPSYSPTLEVRICEQKHEATFHTKIVCLHRKKTNDEHHQFVLN